LPPSPVEIVLLKQLASCLRIPMAILDPRASLLFFNEPAEAIYGVRFDEVGELEADEWTALLQPSDETGAPLKPEDRPVVIALEQRLPAHRRIFVRSTDREPREIELTAVPLVATGDRFLGALAIFWERLPEAPGGPRGGTGAGHAVETILTQRLASTLATPIFLVDAEGRLVYFNPAAGSILGRSFEDVRHATREQLYESFRPCDLDGNPLAPSEHPLAIARLRREPVHAPSRIQAPGGRAREVAVTAIPLIGQSDRTLGAFGIFWEIGQPWK
jgi:PAS domain-containing protein